MLKSISWLQFGSFLLAIGAGYYLYVLGRYYRSEIKSLFMGRTKSTASVKQDSRPTVEGTTIAVRSAVRNQHRTQQKSIVLTGNDYIESELALPLAEEGVANAETEDQLFSLMGKAIVSLKEEMRRAIADEVGRDEVLTRLASVLGKYQQLKGSRYQAKINDFLTRSCSSKFALLLGEEELERLWD